MPFRGGLTDCMVHERIGDVRANTMTIGSARLGGSVVRKLLIAEDADSVTSDGAQPGEDKIAIVITVLHACSNPSSTNPAKQFSTSLAE